MVDGDADADTVEKSVWLCDVENDTVELALDEVLAVKDGDTVEEEKTLMLAVTLDDTVLLTLTDGLEVIVELSVEDALAVSLTLRVALPLALTLPLAVEAALTLDDHVLLPVTLVVAEWLLDAVDDAVVLPLEEALGVTEGVMDDVGVGEDETGTGGLTKETFEVTSAAGTFASEAYAAEAEAETTFAEELSTVAACTARKELSALDGGAMY